MKPFYTNVLTHKGSVLLRGYDENGKRDQRRIKYKPFLFVDNNSNKESPYKTIDNKSVTRIDFESIGACREFMKKYEDVHGFNIYGMTQHAYVYIYQNYAQTEEIYFNRDLIRILYTDIETDSSGGFPDIKAADKEITAITLRFKSKNIVLGYYPWIPENSNTKYIQCKDEVELLNKTIDIINKIDPDIISGWNSDTFDIPYITNRCVRILGEERARQLSPWGIIERRTVSKFGRDHEIVAWAGISSLDFLEVYRKFRSAVKESYRLDFIANLELGVGKVDYSEYGSLDGLYKGNVELYYFYNSIDAERLEQMEDKLHLFDIQIAMSYAAGSNYIDTFATVKPWDVATHNYLLHRNIVVPQPKFTDYYEGIEGAFVKVPLPGRHGWGVSFDVKSLYPSLCRQCNISPETIITTLSGINVDQLYNKELDQKVTDKIYEENVSLCATGNIFDNSFEGFIPAMMRQVYDGRVVDRAKYNEAKKELELLKQEKKRREGT